MAKYGMPVDGYDLGGRILKALKCDEPVKRFSLHFDEGVLVTMEAVIVLMDKSGTPVYEEDPDGTGGKVVEVFKRYHLVEILEETPALK